MNNNYIIESQVRRDYEFERGFKDGLIYMPKYFHSKLNLLK
ncbi:hypothetical protein bwei_1962 [Bacillus mycoides]|nr:hypothetical protein bwei_1962 [Bacillus mycoides]